jgi:hypothetical protein
MGPKSAVKSKGTRGKESPVTVAATPSTTTSPRTPTAAPGGLSLRNFTQEAIKANIHPSLHEEWAESNDHPYLRERSDKLHKAEAEAKAKAEAKVEADEEMDLFDASSEAIFNRYPKSGPNYTDPYFNRDRMKRIMNHPDLSKEQKNMYIYAEEPLGIETSESKAYKQYAADNRQRMNDSRVTEEDAEAGAWYGGRTLKKRKPKKTKKTKTTKKAKKTKKSLKPAKRPTNKKSKRIDKCVISKTKKYRIRSSPPYPANQCPGAKKMGNDGRYYKSVADVNRVYKWARVAK